MMVKKVLMVFLALLMMAAFGDALSPDDFGCIDAREVVKAGGQLEPGQWYIDWKTCKEYADKNGIPVLFIWSNKSCVHCQYTDLVFVQDEFKDWAAKNNAGKVIYCFMAGGESKYPDQQGSDAYNWMYYKGGTQLNAFPFVVLWWAEKGINKRYIGDDFCSGSATGTKFNAKTNLNMDSLPSRVANVIEKMEDAFKDWHLADDKENPFVLPVSRDGYGKGSLYLMSGPNWIKVATTENTKYAVRILMEGSHDSSSPFAATSDDVTISAIDEKFGTGFQFVANEKSEALICLTAQANVSIQLQYAAMDADVPVAFPCAAPIVTHSTESGDYGPERVTLSATAADAQIRYTIDGASVTENSALYTEPFVIEETTTVKAKAFRTGWAESEEVSAVIELKAHCDDGGPYTETVDGVEWMFLVQEGKAGIFNPGYSSIGGSACAPIEGPEYQGDITVPSVLGGCPVAAILSGVFYNCSELTSLVIPEGVTGIGTSAFCGCGKLTSVTIPSSVTSIGDGAFSGCSGLTEVRISDLAAWCRIAFGNGSANPLSYAHKLFINGEETTDIAIPDGVTSIFDYAFYNYRALISAKIPEGVTNIGYEDFYDCSGLMAVSIPEGVTSIGNSAFSGCSGLTSVMIPSSVTYIGLETFCGCEELQSVTIGSSVQEISHYAFVNCTKLTSVTIPASVREIGHGAFMDCKNLSMISVNSGNSVYRSLDGILYDKAGTKLLVCPEGKTGSVQIPSGVTCIGTDSEWPVGVDDTAVQGTFERCAKLDSISIPASATFIAGAAFSGCDNLKSILVDADNPWCCDRDGVLYSKDMATLLCCPGGIEELLIPDDVIDVLRVDDWESCFALDGIGLKTIKVSEGNQIYCAKDGILYSKDKTEMICCPWGRTESVTIPYGVITIGFMAFGNCSVTSLTIPPTVTSIDTSNNFVVFDWITGDYEGGLRNVNVWKGDLDRVKQMLEDCWVPVDRLTFTEVEPGSEAAHWKVGDEVEAWIDAEGMLRIEGRGGMYSWGTFDENWKGWPWEGRQDAITSILIGEGVISVGPGAFEGCGRVLSVELPESLTLVEASAFSNCSSLREVTIPENVREIRSGAFGGCRKLADVYFAGEQLPSLDTDVFGLCSSDIMLHAPSGWEGRSRVVAGCQLEVSGESSAPVVVNVIVTNVVVQYVLNSVQPEFAIPATSDAGFVNIITEVKGGSVAVPATWASEYPNFVSKYGSDFTKALTMKTGKKDGAGNEMLVWQDYVAGTDPTNEKDVFTASITIVDGKVTISYTPELDDARKAMRKYTIWGKTSLMDANWTEVPEGREAEYNFFKVSVEMQ